MTDEKPAKRSRLLIYVNGDTLGDGLLKLPVLMSLRKAFPAYHLTWLSGRGPSVFNGVFAPLVEGAIDRVEDSMIVGEKWSELIVNPLRKEFFDIIIDTQKSLLTTMILRGIPHGIFISSTAGFLFSDNKPRSGKKSPEQIQEQLLELVGLACGNETVPDYTLDLPQKYREVAATLIPTGPVYIGISPGAGQKIKCWPLERFISVAKHQVIKSRRPVFFLGPQEQHMIDTIRSEVPEALFPEQEPGAAQAKGPMLSIALAEKMTLCLANDSGTGHIMAAAMRPLISLFGPSNAGKFTSNITERFVINARDYGGRDMSCIPTEAVNNTIDSILS